jgi:hypothetical protein
MITSALAQPRVRYRAWMASANPNALELRRDAGSR